MRYSDIPGHEEVKRRLRQLVDSDRIPHALLLEGPSGIGKFALARATAQYIHCQHPTAEGDSCGKCPSCLQHQSYNHIDTIYTFPVVKNNGIGRSDDYMDEFRQMTQESIFMDIEKWQSKLDNINAQPQIYVEEAVELIRKLSFTNHGARYKIVLMWLPERLKEEAANKLLKLIEEPSEDTLFILASDNSRGILPTIYSRTQRITVSRYSDSEISDYLLHTYDMQPDDAQHIARLAAGSITRAEGMINLTKDSDTFLNLFMELMRKAYSRRVADLKNWAADVAALGREREIKFIEYCTRMLRENFILNLHNPDLNYLTKTEMDFSRNFSPFINERNVEKLFKILNDAKVDIGANANAKLVNFDVAIKVILLLKK